MEAIAASFDNSRRAVAESERRWVTTLASIGDGVIAAGSDGRVTFLNPVAAALTGCSTAPSSKPASSRRANPSPQGPAAGTTSRRPSAPAQTEETDLQASQRLGTIEALEAFLSKHPRGKCTASANDALDALVVSRSKQSADMASYCAYLKKWPDGKHWPEAAQNATASLGKRFRLISVRGPGSLTSRASANGPIFSAWS